MAFKLGSEKRGFKTSKNTPLFRKQMNDGSSAQANMDGSIDIDPSVDINSKFGRRVIKHEQAHIDQIESGRGAYGDGWVMWEDKIYLRGEEDGVKYIDGPNGRWPEGDEHHPWEAEAIAAEKINNNNNKK
jgi:hypothetical protein|tara:strand:- start:138 stop:527 length:390 start_codon:yes stop_codon:yes gene_type:complete